MGKADYIFSSIPLALIPKGVKRSILQNAVSNLKPNGKYIQFQYSLADYKLLKKHFSRVRLKFTMLNFPPAFVYSCSV
jgi:phospholipid N-methyltransferase